MMTTTLPMLTPSLKAPLRARLKNPRVAIKVQRRKYSTAALDEIQIHGRIDRTAPESRYIVGFYGALMHDSHVCQAYELHGRESCGILKSGPLPISDVKILTRQI